MDEDAKHGLREGDPEELRHTTHALAWLPPRIARLSSRLDAKPSGVAVKDLGDRWASCGKAATLNFDWRTILLAPHIIDHLIVHELAHLHEPHHTPPSGSA